MKILFINQEGHVAGSTLSLSYLAEGLARKGHTVYVACRPATLQSSLVSESGVTMIPLTINGALDTAAIRRIRDIVRHYEIDIVNAQSSKDRYASIFSRFFYKLPCVLVHTRRQMPSSSGGKLQAWFYTRGTDAMIAVSNPVKQGLIEKGIPAGHIHVIHNGTPRGKYSALDSSVTDKLRERHRLSSHAKVIGCVARSSRRKHHLQLVRALQYVREPVVVLFVGADMRPEYAKAIRAIEHQHTVHFCGIVPPVESLHYFKLFTMLVLPSTMEGLSQSVLEAMALGVPAVATASGGNIDLIRDGENGLLFRNRDIQGLAHCIERLLGDKSLRTTIAAQGKQTAFVEFSIAHTIRRHDQFFRSLVERASAKGWNTPNALSEPGGA
ncbi:MAG: glycosyltransferase [Chitinivibrionales bacterium]|nr:glycosyltransferase [Chitinivibrionales bacterium]MBD3356869.1 glycosyltransferase [Chitinivibrionales bacterium]